MRAAMSGPGLPLGAGVGGGLAYGVGHLIWASAFCLQGIESGPGAPWCASLPCQGLRLSAPPTPSARGAAGASSLALSSWWALVRVRVVVSLSGGLMGAWIRQNAELF